MTNFVFFDIILITAIFYIIHGGESIHLIESL